MSLSRPFRDFSATNFAVFVLSLILGSSATASTDFYVSPKGNDHNTGSSASPWRTIQKGANSATAGSTVHVLAGTYSERVVVRVSGNSTQGSITFKGEGAILDDAANPISGSTFVAAFLIDSRSYVTVTGFEIRNYIAKNANSTPVGILVHGTSHDIVIGGNLIHSIVNNISANSNAHGIAVYGTGHTEATAIHNILIANNELHSLHLGASEALVVNGNVDGFTIQGNSVHDCDNIAIDAIGFEGTSVDPFDQARNGLISNNDIARIDSRGNPAYGNDRSADGIYVDGGKNITIDSNTIAACNIGIELASEHHGRVTSQITVTNNLVTGSHTVGMSLGGYDNKRGATRNCLIKNNTLHGNDTDNNGNGELMLQYLVQNNTLEYNVFASTNQNILISNPFKTSTGNVVDFNTYISPGGPNHSIWIWNNVEYDDFSTYQETTGNDHDSTSESS